MFGFGTLPERNLDYFIAKLNEAVCELVPVWHIGLKAANQVSKLLISIRASEVGLPE